VQDYIKRFGQKKCEADALVVRPDAGRGLCASAILGYVSTNGIKRFEQAQRRQQRAMRKALDKLLGR
jgi:hypothetical protein